MKQYNEEKVFQENNIIYEIQNDQELYVVGNLLDRISHVEIPHEIEEKGTVYKVTGIGSDAFKESRYLEYIDIPHTIRFVGESAFSGSDVKDVFFYGDVPSESKMIKLEESIFSECIRLETIKMPNNLKVIPEYCFFNCQSLRDIEIGYYIEEIGERAFYNNKSLRRIDFMDGFNKIGLESFAGSNLYYAEIGTNVSHCGEGAFTDINNLHTLVIASPNVNVGECFVRNEQKVTIYIKGKKGTDEVNSVLANIDEKHHVIVDDFLYWEEDGVIYLVFSKGVARVVGYVEKSIREHTVILDHVGPATITDFGPGVFKYSSKLKTCVFPKTIKRTKINVFEGCKNFESVTFNHRIESEEAERIVGSSAKIFYHDS